MRSTEIFDDSGVYTSDEVAPDSGDIVFVLVFLGRLTWFSIEQKNGSLVIRDRHKNANACKKMKKKTRKRC